MLTKNSRMCKYWYSLAPKWKSLRGITNIKVGRGGQRMFCHGLKTKLPVRQDELQNGQPSGCVPSPTHPPTPFPPLPSLPSPTGRFEYHLCYTLLYLQSVQTTQLVNSSNRRTCHSTQVTNRSSGTPVVSPRATTPQHNPASLVILIMKSSPRMLL